MKIMIHVDKTSSASITLILHCQTIDILMSLKHGNSLLLIGEFKMGKQANSQGYGKSKMATWFPSSLTNLIFIWLDKAFQVAARLMPSQWKMFMFRRSLNPSFVTHFWDHSVLLYY